MALGHCINWNIIIILNASKIRLMLTTAIPATTALKYVRDKVIPSTTQMKQPRNASFPGRYEISHTNFNST